MASSVNYSQFYYKWASIRHRWLEFGRKNRKIQQVNDYLRNIYAEKSPFLTAICYDESTQLVLPHDEYIKAKGNIEKIIHMELPKIPKMDLSSINPVVRPVDIRDEDDLRYWYKECERQNSSLRLRQQEVAKQHEQKVKNYLHENPEITYLIVDVEMYEYNHSIITEVGFAIFKRNQYHKAEYFHYIIAENRKYVNKDHVPDNRGGFRFGTSVVAPLEEAKRALEDQVGRASAIVGHNIKNDKETLKDISFGDKFLIDTEKLALAQEKVPKPMSLKRVLESHSVPFDQSDLHNAGNDCHYTMKAFEALIKLF